jgi:pimeloyl-ACP methyl ester carboxylesterase
MKLHTHPTRGDEHAQAPTRRTGTGSPARNIAGSLAIGLVLALVLVAVVFPGATESVVTGSILVAFGVGWGALAALTSRRTSQAQPWARVPAAAMGVTGLALIVFGPQNEVLTLLNWVWPPLLLALVVWMFRQMRRSLTGRGRWLLTPMLVALALAAIGGTTADVSELRIAHEYAAAPGATYLVNGHRLHLDCRGSGSPTVVLFSGLSEFSQSWTGVTQQVNRTTRVCAYDRAGQGWSDDVSTPQDGLTAAHDLHTLLAAAGEHGPYVLVGHSIGGPYALTYAAQYPEQVAGMVLLDSSSPQQMTEIANYSSQYPIMRRGLALLPTLTRIGLGRFLGTGAGLPGNAGAEVQAMTSTARSARNGRDEVSILPRLFEESQALTTLQAKPLEVVTASENLGTGGWSATQDRLTALSSNHRHIVVQSSHEGLLMELAGAIASAHAIDDVVAAVRRSSPVR